jgi:hypothetical protein
MIFVIQGDFIEMTFEPYSIDLAFLRMRKHTHLPLSKKEIRVSCNSKFSSIILTNMESHNAPHILSIPPHAFAENGFLSYVTNTVFSTWIFIVIVAIFAAILYIGSRRKSGFVRSTGFLIVKNLKAFFEPLLGHTLPIDKTLWFIGGVFIYIF